MAFLPSDDPESSDLLPAITMSHMSAPAPFLAGTEGHAAIGGADDRAARECKPVKCWRLRPQGMPWAAFRQPSI